MAIADHVAGVHSEEGGLAPRERLSSGDHRLGDATRFASPASEVRRQTLRKIWNKGTSDSIPGPFGYHTRSYLLQDPLIRKAHAKFHDDERWEGSDRNKILSNHRVLFGIRKIPGMHKVSFGDKYALEFVLRKMGDMILRANGMLRGYYMSRTRALKKT